MHTKTFHERLPAWAFASRTALSRKHMDPKQMNNPDAGDPGPFLW